MKWISVKERLPSEDQTVLVFDEFNKLIYTAHLYLGSWNCSCNCHEGSGVYNVSYWMPLPRPPIDEDENEMD